MKRVLVAAAAALAVGTAGLAGGPAVAEPGKGKGTGPDPAKERGPALKLKSDMVRLDDVASFQCTATVEDATAREVVVETCQAFRGGVVVAESAGASASGNRASSVRWTGVLPGNGGVTVCISAHALLTTGTVL